MDCSRRAQAECAQRADALAEANPPDCRQHRGIRISGADPDRRRPRGDRRPRPLRRSKLLGLKQVPVIEVRDLSEAKRRALALADNKIAENAGWDRELLSAELPELSELLVVEGLDISITGFAPVEIDQITADFEDDPSDPADTVDPRWATAALVTRPGDLWQLGHHRLL